MILGMCLTGIAALIAALALTVTEMEGREEHYKEKLHTKLRFYDDYGWQECELFRMHYVIGRRKKKCDLAPDIFRADKRVSREHALFWYDGKEYHIAPIYRPFNAKPYTEILVNGSVVPNDGAIVGYDDEISIMGHVIRLVDKEDEDDA